MKRENTKKKKSFGHDFLIYMLESEPQSFQEVGPQWKEVIKREKDSILQN